VWQLVVSAGLTRGYSDLADAYEAGGRRDPANALLYRPPYTDPYVRWCGRGEAARLPPIPMCAGHARRLGGASPLCNLMEVKH